VCLPGYVLKDGVCSGRMDGLWSYFMGFVCLLLLVIILWYVVLVCRPIINARIRDLALAARWRASLHDTRGTDAW